MCNDEIKYHEKKIIINDNKKRREQKLKKKGKEKIINTNMLVRLTVKLISWCMFFPPNISSILWGFFKLNTCLCICSSDTSYNGLIIYISENEKIEKINVDYDLINFKFIYCSEISIVL